MTCPVCNGPSEDGRDCPPCERARAMFDDALATLCGAVIARQAELMEDAA